MLACAHFLWKIIDCNDNHMACLHRRSHMKAGGGSCLLLDFPVFASSCLFIYWNVYEPTNEQDFATK